MKHLLNLKELTLDEINLILREAQCFAEGAIWHGAAGKIAANLFFEPSTRTQYSFHVAEEKLDMKTVSFNPAGSSLTKGESFYDTVKVFESFGVDALVIRHTENEYYSSLLPSVKLPIINGGDGTGNHPTQSLLDLLTIQQEFGSFGGLKIAICGDVAHSRVAHTNIEVMERLGMEVTISGPEEYQEEGCKYIAFDKAVTEMDILMLLRVQHERHSEKMNLTKEAYNIEYGLSLAKVAKMKPTAIIMHPAPFNRGVELDDDVVECAKSRIFKQIQNGVYIRMAVLKRAFGGF